MELLKKSIADEFDVEVWLWCSSIDENVDVVVNPPVYRLMLEAMLLLGLAVRIDEDEMMGALVLLPLLFRCKRGGGAVKVLLLLIFFVKIKSSSLGKYM